MDTVAQIFTQLGVDASLLPQFLLICVLFVVAKFLFLNQIQFVLENREEKTVKLENSADETLERVNKLGQTYKTKIDAANKDAMKNLLAKKGEIQSRLNDQVKKTEREINQFVEESRMQFEREVEANKAKFLAEADGLSNDLVKKIVN